MKLLLVLCVVCYVSGEAPYPASGWRPSGPAFELPEKNSQKPQNQYLPPGDPRSLPSDSSSNVSVQGLPAAEETPEFQVSPVSGQQFVGPDFNADIARLNERYRQELIQQQRIQEILKQQQQPQTSTTNPTPRTSQNPNFKTTKPNEDRTTTDATDLNLGEVSPDEPKVSVEVSKQKIQEYPELLLSPLTQIRLVKNGRLVESQKSRGFDGPIHLAALQSILRQNQQVVQNQEVIQNQAFIAPQEQPNTFLIIPQGTNQQLTEPQYQIQPVLLQPEDLKYGAPQENPDAEEIDEKEVNQPQAQYQPQAFQPQQIQPQQQYQPQYQIQQQQFVAQQFQPQAQLFQPQAQQFQPQVQQLQPQQQQFQPQSQQYQPQAQQFQPQAEQIQPQNQQYQPQVQQFQPQQQQFQPQQQQFQPQAQQFQPQQQYQPNSALNQPQNQDNQNQLLLNQAQLINFQPLVNQDLAQYYQNQQILLQQQQQFQRSLQSGFEVDQENGVEDKEEKTERSNDDGSATAVATAFGARTRPRVFTQYGAPVPAQATTEATQQDEVPSEEGPAVAVATAEARGRRKSAKLRNRRVRPVFTVDQAGHLVLSQDQ